MDRDERLAALDEVVNETLSENGYAGVDVEGGDVSPNYGETSADGTTITFDEQSTIESDDAVEALDTAYHEAGHAMREQDGGEELLTSDEVATFNDRGLVGSIDDEGELHLESTLSPFHDDVAQYASLHDYWAGDRRSSRREWAVGSDGGSAAVGERRRRRIGRSGRRASQQRVDVRARF